MKSNYLDFKKNDQNSLIAVRLEMGKCGTSYDEKRDLNITGGVYVSIRPGNRYRSESLFYKLAQTNMGGLVDSFFLYCDGLSAADLEAILTAVASDPTCPVKETALYGNTPNEISSEIEKYCLQYCKWVKEKLGIILTCQKDWQTKYYVPHLEILAQLGKIYLTEKVFVANLEDPEPFLPSIANPSIVQIKKAIYNICRYDQKQNVFLKADQHSLRTIFKALSEHTIRNLNYEFHKTHKHTRVSCNLIAASDLVLNPSQIHSAAEDIYKFLQANPGKLLLLPECAANNQVRTTHSTNEFIKLDEKGDPILPSITTELSKQGVFANQQSTVQDNKSSDKQGNPPKKSM